MRCTKVENAHRSAREVRTVSLSYTSSLCPFQHYTWPAWAHASAHLGLGTAPHRRLSVAAPERGFAGKAGSRREPRHPPGEEFWTNPRPGWCCDFPLVSPGSENALGELE